MYPATLDGNGRKQRHKWRDLVRIAKLHNDNRKKLDALHRRQRKPFRKIYTPKIEVSDDKTMRPGELTVSQASAVMRRSTAVVLHHIAVGNLPARSVPFARSGKRSQTAGAKWARENRAKKRKPTQRRSYYVQRSDVDALIVARKTEPSNTPTARRLRAYRRATRASGFQRRADVTTAHVVALRFDGLTLKQIAATLGVSVTTVSRRLAEWK